MLPLHERQFAKGVEGNRGDEPFERPEQDALVDDLANEAEGDAGQSKDRPEHRITSLARSVTHVPIVPTNRDGGEVLEGVAQHGDCPAPRKNARRGVRSGHD